MSKDEILERAAGLQHIYTAWFYFLDEYSLYSTLSRLEALSHSSLMNVKRMNECILVPHKIVESVIFIPQFAKGKKKGLRDRI